MRMRMREQTAVRVHPLPVLHEEGDGGFLGGGGKHLLLLQLPPLGLVAAVLEPDLHLGLGQLQGPGQVGALRARQVALVAEASLQLVDLPVRERGSRSLATRLLLVGGRA